MKNAGFKISRLIGEYLNSDRHSIKADYEIFLEVNDVNYLKFNVMTEGKIIKITFKVNHNCSYTETGERTASLIEYSHEYKMARIKLTLPINLKSAEYNTREGFFPVIEFQLSLDHKAIYYSTKDIMPI